MAMGRRMGDWVRLTQEVTVELGLETPEEYTQEREGTFILGRGERTCEHEIAWYV